MASTNLEMSIKTLREYINRMMDKCERAVELSVNSMINKDMDLAKRVIDDDDDIDILREYIRDRSIELMALKQPMAKDLREIYALSDISAELERYSIRSCINRWRGLYKTINRYTEDD